MRKLRFAALLPVLQVTLAAILLQWAGPPDSYWSEPMLICRGLNAPALLFMAPTMWPPISELARGRVLGISISDIFFLVGVLVVWYLVGRALDRRLDSQRRDGPGPLTALIAHLMTLAVGGILLYVALHDFQYPNFDNLGHRPERAILTLAWSISLILISVRGLLRVIRSRVRRVAAGETIA
jgi:hypothetical protein